MIRSPIGLRINPDPGRSPREQLREAAKLGARGVVLDAAGDLAPERLGETGRRDLRKTLRGLELELVALSLPTRRSFDTEEQIDERLARAERAFAMAYELGARLVLARVGPVPEESDPARLTVFDRALGELVRRADRHGVRLAVELGEQPGATLSAFLNRLGDPALAASLDPASSLRAGHDPVASVVALGRWLAHAYATELTESDRSSGANPRGFGFRPGANDWEEYLGSLEEVDYRGYLTLWPDPNRETAPQVRQVLEILRRF